MNFERLDAIKRMMNVPEDTEGIRLSTGEVIRPWDCLNDQFSPVGIEELPDEVKDKDKINIAAMAAFGFLKTKG